MMGGGRMKKAMIKKALADVDVRDVPAAEPLANTWGGIEAKQVETANRLAAAADLELSIDHSQDERADQLLDLADAATNEEIREWWFTEYAADHIKNQESARRLSGLEKDEWREQMATWGSKYRQARPDLYRNKTDAQIAADHVRQQFDVDLATFSKEVVEWSIGDHLEAILLGHLLAVDDVMTQVARKLEDAE